jgi:hypothetical protein
MNLTILFENKYLVALVSSLAGVILTLITERVLNKRGLFTYFVRHNRVGLSTDDAIFGSVRVTWNENPVGNLFSSAVEMANESMKDYENVVVRVFTNDTVLLTERTEIAGTTHLLSWTDDFSKQLAVAPSQAPSQSQRDLYSRQRDYLIPTMNRGQVVRFHFLNAARTQNPPSIWLDILHKGVKLRFRLAHAEVLGVRQPLAALAGVISGFVFVGLLVAFVPNVWVAAICALLYGLVAQIPGALLLKLWRLLRDFIGG